MLSRRRFLAAGAATPSVLPFIAPNAFAQSGDGSTYSAGTAEQALDIINLHDLEDQARELIPAPQFGYIRSGSGDEWTLRENVRAFDDRQILPRYLVGIDQPDTTTELLGSKVDIPIFVPPMAWHMRLRKRRRRKARPTRVRYSPPRRSPTCLWETLPRRAMARNGSSYTIQKIRV